MHFAEVGAPMLTGHHLETLLRKSNSRTSNPKRRSLRYSIVAHPLMEQRGSVATPIVAVRVYRKVDRVSYSSAYGPTKTHPEDAWIIKDKRSLTFLRRKGRTFLRSCEDLHG